MKQPAFLDRAEDQAGYPDMDFEEFYQQGISCFTWGLPKSYARQAFLHLCKRWEGRGKQVEMWHVRAFVYGCKGLCESGKRERRAALGYVWPTPPDRSWETIVCLYPNGACELDFVHPVSRMFWSEDNGFLILPTDDYTVLGGWWFEEMGFEIMVMQPLMQAQVADSKTPHLKLV